jgi:hypothetical protein
MAATIIEGTWEEIAEKADELAGKRVRLIVLGEANGADRDRSTCKLTPEEWDRRVDEHAARYKGVPVLPPEAFDRENLYDDRI